MSDDREATADDLLRERNDALRAQMAAESEIATLTAQRDALVDACHDAPLDKDSPDYGAWCDRIEALEAGSG